MGLLDGYIDSLKGLLASRDACKFNFGGIPDAIKTVSPTFRMFMDSELGSPIEDATKKMWADSIVGGLRNTLPNNNLSEKIAIGFGSWIGEKANSFMDRVKLMNHYSKGYISIDKYLDVRSTQIQATMVNVTKLAKKFQWVARKAICAGLESVGITEPESTLGKIAELTGIRRVVKFVGEKIENAAGSEKTNKLIKAGIVTFHEGVNKINNACRTIKDAVDPVIETVAKKIDTAVDNVVTYAKKSVRTVVENTRKFYNWVKGKIFG